MQEIELEGRLVIRQGQIVIESEVPGDRHWIRVHQFIQSVWDFTQRKKNGWLVGNYGPYVRLTIEKLANPEGEKGDGGD